MTPNVRLVIGGVSWSGWTSARISRSLEALTSKFELGLVDEPGALARLVAQPGTLCKIYDNTRLMLTGVVEDFEIDEQSNTYRLNCSGRGLTLDISDSDIVEAIRFNGQSAAQIAAAIGGLHGLGVQVDTPAALVPLKRMTAGVGDSQREILERAARLAGVQLTDTPAGLIRLCRPSTASAGEVGTYISAKTSASSADIFSRVVCRSQVAIPDADSVDVWATMSADITEPLGARNRSIVIQPEQGLDRDGCRRRALTEAARRAGQAVSTVVELGGWRTWEPGEVYRFRSDAAGIDAPLVVADIGWSISADTGPRTNVTMRPPAAYLAEEPQQRRRSPGTGSRYWGDLQTYAATVPK